MAGGDYLGTHAARGVGDERINMSLTQDFEMRVGFVEQEG